MTNQEIEFENMYANYGGGIIYIPLTLLEPHPDNPRKNLGDLDELTASIAQNGILQNLTVVPIRNDDNEGDGEETGRFRIVIGHRRAAAAARAGEETAPCIVNKVMTEREEIETMLIENMQRSDLNAFEQAESFQMMLDLGGVDPVGIARRTGFSETTVRRRLKMAELDRAKLREVAEDEERQLTLGDFDRLAQIEDINERNKVLEKIGTNDFNFALNNAVSRQEEAKNMPKAEEWLKSVGAKNMSNSEQWSNKYENYSSGSSQISIRRWEEDKKNLPKDTTEPVFYYISYGTLYLKKKKPKAPKDEKTPEQKAHDKAVREAQEKMKSMTASFYELRKAFVEKLVANGENRVRILTAALWGGLLHSICYRSPVSDTQKELLGMECQSWDPKREQKMRDGLNTITDQKLPQLVYTFFADSANMNYVERYATGSGFPEYAENVALDMLYSWLIGLGYEVSTEEAMWKMGTHEIWNRGETEDV